MDLGDSVTHTVSIFKGYALPHAIQRLEIGGREISEFMSKIISEVICVYSKAGYQIEDIYVIKEIEEKLYYLA